MHAAWWVDAHILWKNFGVGKTGVEEDWCWKDQCLSKLSFKELSDVAEMTDELNKGS